MLHGPHGGGGHGGGGHHGGGGGRHHGGGGGRGWGGRRVYGPPGGWIYGDEDLCVDLYGRPTYCPYLPVLVDGLAETPPTTPSTGVGLTVLGIGLVAGYMLYTKR